MPLFRTAPFQELPLFRTAPFQNCPFTERDIRMNITFIFGKWKTDDATSLSIGFPPRVPWPGRCGVYGGMRRRSGARSEQGHPGVWRRQPQKCARRGQCVVYAPDQPKARGLLRGELGAARQIESGAPADIFISADLDWMDYLAQRNLIKSATRSNFLGNTLVLVAPADSRVTLTIGRNFPLATALGGGRLALADPAAVPAGKYGKAALEALGGWSSVADKIAPAPDVRAALVLVARGETPLGIVYQTDAAADKAVKTVGTFPADTHPPIIYPIAITASSTHPDAQSY